jgi:hypothetical protein
MIGEAERLEREADEAFDKARSGPHGTCACKAPRVDRVTVRFGRTIHRCECGGFFLPDVPVRSPMEGHLRYIAQETPA